MISKGFVNKIKIFFKLIGILDQKTQKSRKSFYEEIFLE